MKLMLTKKSINNQQRLKRNIKIQTNIVEETEKSDTIFSLSTSLGGFTGKFYPVTSYYQSLERGDSSSLIRQRESIKKE